MERRRDYQDNRRGGGGRSPSTRGYASSSSPSSSSGANDKVAARFGCSSKQLTSFRAQDPFNPSMTLDGWVCMADGPYFGSLYVAKCNGDHFEEPQIIYGIPKINALPSGSPNGYRGSPKPSTGANPFTQLPACRQFYLANKWNGFSVTAFKYKDTRGVEYVSVKPRGHAFVKDISPAMATLSTVRKLLQIKATDQLIPDELPAQLQMLENPDIQSITLEICGSDEPQLVAYKFALEAKPLFATRWDGSIVPCPLLASPPPAMPYIDQWEANNIECDVGPLDFDANKLKALTGQFRYVASQLNEEYRQSAGRPIGLYFNNFVVEGKVLYLLDGKGSCISRETGLFKIKPKDLMGSHWPIFDNFLQARAIEALEKIYANIDARVDGPTLKREMDLSDREWDRFSEQILTFVSGYPDPRQADPTAPLKVVVMVGLPGSGKSTVSNRLAAAGWCRVNQDEMGTRQVCEDVSARALKMGQNLVVDRCNFDFSQRAHFLKLAAKFGVKDFRCVFLDVPAEICKARVQVRPDHPTIPMGDSGAAIIDNFGSLLVAPRRGEGFNEILIARNEEEANLVAEHILDTVQ